MSQDPLPPLLIVIEFVAGQRGPLNTDATFPRLPRSSVWSWASVLANGMRAECQVPASWNLLQRQLLSLLVSSDCCLKSCCSILDLRLRDGASGGPRTTENIWSPRASCGYVAISTPITDLQTPYGREGNFLSCLSHRYSGFWFFVLSFIVDLFSEINT